MSTKCSVCNKKSGYFKLKDTVCSPCRDQAKKSSGRMRQIITYCRGSASVFFLSIAGYIAGISNGHFHAVLAISIIICALFSLAFSSLVRFIILRRSIGVKMALTLSIPSFVLLNIGLLVNGAGPANLTPWLFLIFPYYVLRLPNAWNDYEATKNFSTDHGQPKS